MTMTQARNTKDIATEWAAAWNAADQTRLAALFAIDGTYTDLAIGKSFVGGDAITGFKALSDAAIANLNIEILNTFGDVDQIAIESIYSGHFRGAPSAFAVRGTTTLRIVNGLIATNTDNYSVATVLAQSGLPADWTPPTT
jgi:ketosteroid isomerase-like protein